MSLEITDAFLDDLRHAIEAGDREFILHHLDELHPADAAQILNLFEDEQAVKAYQYLPEELAAEAILLLDDDKREMILSRLTSEEIADRVIDNLATDDAADVLAELSDEQQDEVLSHVEDMEQASDIVDLLNYDPDTAGGIMAKELVKVHASKNVWECVREIRTQAEGVENIYTIYVVDDDERLVGLLSLKNLLTKPLRTPVTDVINPNIVSVRVHEPAEVVAQVMDKYDLVVVPVVDSLKRLVGRITVDDIVDVIREEVTEDVQKMGAVQALDEPYMNVPFWSLVKKRLGWLVILFIGELLTATAMRFYSDQIDKAVILAAFIPLIISSGGNSGSQASTLVIRALSLGEITVRDWWRILRKEINSGLVLGLVLGALGFLRVAIWANYVEDYGPYWMLIGCTVGVTLVGVVLWGCLMGSLLPLLLKRLGLDPAVSSTPFVATLVDVTGLLIYFNISTAFLKGLLI